MEHYMQPISGTIQGIGIEVTGKEDIHYKNQKSAIKLTIFPNSSY